MSTAKPDIVTPEQWRAAREALLEQEKAHTRARDALAAERRRMPMIRVEKDYRFTAPGGGDATLLDASTAAASSSCTGSSWIRTWTSTRSAAAPAARCTPTS
jgi:hypothetical protein